MMTKSKPPASQGSHDVGQKNKSTVTKSKFSRALSKALIRPELGSICGVISVFLIFFIIAHDSGMFGPQGIINWATVSAQFAIIAVGACMLMIAGEFDLSVGSMIGFSGVIIAVLSVHLGWPVWLSIMFAFALAMAVGALSGYIVIKTGLPSFIVTLGFLFILRGLTIFIAISATRKTIIGGLHDAAADDWLAPLFSGKILKGLFVWLADIGVLETFSRGTREGQPIIEGIPMLIVWAVGLIIVAHWVLSHTRLGNWIYASGGDANAARNCGVPVNRVKIAMFMVAAFCATVFATCQIMEFGSAGADRGILKEFEAIISVVIGGALLTGGYGSVIGAGMGALIFGVVQQGLFFAGVESSLFRVFLGVLLLFAVILNNRVRLILTKGS